YLVTLGGHSFYWFSLERPRTSELDARMAAYQPPTFDVAEDWEPTLHTEERATVEGIIPAWLQTRPWFEADGRRLTGVRVVEAVPVEGREGVFDLLVVEAAFASGSPTRYLLPLGLAMGARADAIRREAPHAVIANAHAHDGGARVGVLFDALADAS